MKSEPPGVLQLWPLLLVNDIEKSIRFYTALGFAVIGKAETENGVFWCRLQRGGACFMLQQKPEEQKLRNPPAPEVAFYLVCDNADALYEEFSGRGLSVEPPSLAYYGMRQLFVPDPDGYSVCFESATEEWAG